MRSVSWWPAAVALAPVLCSASGIAQVDPTSRKHPLHDLVFLEGSWIGEMAGTLGPATGGRQYHFIVRDRFLLMKHDRDPPEHASGGGIFEEWSIFSFDIERELIVLRQFLAVGLVNTYACTLDRATTRLMCESEATEGSTGLSLKLRYDIADRDHFTETFEVLGPEGSLQVRMEGRWLRTGGPG